mmetsp:Transcript_19907/g.33552  ORF Transcript_19907/g.33552 Transcript_19907/m.33552 type:complete len:210 (-) Transcript_19907:3428-4057(-)
MGGGQSKKAAAEQKAKEEEEENVELNFKVVHSAIRWDKPVSLLEKYYTREPAAVTMQDDRNGNFPIHIAAQNGFDAHVQLLLDHGADINAVNGKGNTPLHMAWSYDYVSTAELLTSKGANVHQANDKGFTASCGIDGDKCRPIVYLLTSKCTDDILAALGMAEVAAEEVEKGNFVSKCMAFKKKLAKDGLDIWTSECDDRMKEVMAKLS